MQSQGVTRVILFPKVGGKNASCFSQLLVAPGSLGLGLHPCGLWSRTASPSLGLRSPSSLLCKNA